MSPATPPSPANQGPNKCPIIINGRKEKLILTNEFSIAKNEASVAEKWGRLAKDAATAAKINPSSLSKSDLQGGLNGFAELVKAVEETVDVISIMPKFRYMPQDAPDFIIYCYVNYVRDLKGLPPCEYWEIYEFYDKNKQTYIEQYGDPFEIFKDDIDISNRENIKKFLIDYSAQITNKKEEDAKKEDDVFGD